MRLSLGTKSLLFGVHQFLVHPITVAIAWVKLYGFRKVPDPYVGRVSILDPRVMFAVFVHDIGYFGKTDMDGVKGIRHPIFGALMCGSLFGEEWAAFSLGHSSSMTSMASLPCVSSLYAPDKYAMVITPTWLYLLLARASGEMKEYRKTYTEYAPNEDNDIKWVEKAKETLKTRVQKLVYETGSARL